MRKLLLVFVALLLIVSMGLACIPADPPPPPPPPPPAIRATIIRDNFGVPHVYANTTADLAFGMGYAMAQDRLWQADIMRRAASGRLAEFLGPGSLAADRDAVTRWYNQSGLFEIYQQWNPGVGNEHLKPMIEAYVEGINLYIARALAGHAVGDWSLIPIEYIAQGLVPRLTNFTVADVVAITVMMAWRFGGTGGNEAVFAEALLGLQALHGATNGTAIWNELFPLNDPGSPVTIPGAGGLSLSSMSLPTLSEDLGALLKQYEESQTALDELLESLGLPTKLGSNAVLVHKNLSATDTALQLGGPQMGYTIPQIVYEVGLHGAGINAQGMAMPGAGPFILIGVNEHGAWTSTTGMSDVVDIRILTLNSTTPPFSYQWWNGTDFIWRDLPARNETIRVRVGAANWTDVIHTVYTSHYGPVVSLNGTTAVAVHTPFWKNELAAEQGWQLFQQATSIAEFEEAVKLVQPSHNFFWADRLGNIGYWHAGTFPKKPFDPRLPLLGDGTQEWVGVTNFTEMPRSINPAQGWLVNWNNKPIANWPYAESDFGWGEGHRNRILDTTLTALVAATGSNLTIAHINQTNVVGAYHHTAGVNFLGTLIARATAYLNATPDPDVAGALTHLEAWATASPLPVSYVDLAPPAWPAPNATYDHAGLTIFDAWYSRIVPSVLNTTLPPALVDRVRGNPSLLLRIFRGNTTYDYLGGRDLNNLTIDALKAAISALTTRYGSSNMSTWLTPVAMQFYTPQGALPGGNFHPRMNRGTYNHIASLSSPLPTAVAVIPPGQSGFVRFPGVPSLFVADQVPLYAAWLYKPMLFQRSAVEAVETLPRTILYVD